MPSSVVGMEWTESNIYGGLIQIGTVLNTLHLFIYLFL